MNLLSQALVIARRDFVSIVATPTFLLFLLAPLLMIGLSALGGLSAGQMAVNAGNKERIVVIGEGGDLAAIGAADARLRRVAGGRGGPPLLVSMSRDDVSGLDAAKRNPDVLAIMEGPLAAPRITEREANSFEGSYLATLADTVVREGGQAAAEAATRPSFTTLRPSSSGVAARTGLGSGIVFLLFLLTLLLAGQSVGMLAEEKGNKVIEILAAAVRLEAVFFGKLIGMLGVAILFVAFWGLLIGGSVMAAVSRLPGETAQLLTLTPAIGWPLFIAFGFAYFLCAFLLLGAVFLSVGAQASTVREIQMLSLPITFFQIGMFLLASAAAASPDSSLAGFAGMFPWSSPFAMAALGATDAAVWPHLAALGWQALWIALTIWIGVKLFRAGVLRSGGSWWPWAKAPAPAIER